MGSSGTSIAECYGGGGRQPRSRASARSLRRGASAPLCYWAVGFVLIGQGASQLHGIGTLPQPHDQPILQCPHVCETRGEPLAAFSGTSRIAAEGDDVFA